MNDVDRHIRVLFLYLPENRREATLFICFGIPGAFGQSGKAGFSPFKVNECVDDEVAADFWTEESVAGREVLDLRVCSGTKAVDGVPILLSGDLNLAGCKGLYVPPWRQGRMNDNPFKVAFRDGSGYECLCNMASVN